MTGKLRLFGAAVIIVLAAVTALLGQPTAAERVARSEQQLAADLAGRQFHVDPGELLDLMYDPTVNLLLFDVRPETDYNLFHLSDARRMAIPDLDQQFVRDYPENAVKIVMSNDEADAEKTWRRLKAQGMLNVYILAGGVNFWLDVYGGTTPAGFIPAHDDVTADGHSSSISLGINTRFDSAAVGDDSLQHRFLAAHGDGYPASRPDLEHLPPRSYEIKVVIQQAGPKVSGGCG